MRHQRMKMVSVFMIMLLILVLTGCGGGSESKYIDGVKNGNLLLYPEKTIGQAFNDFFKSPRWEYFKGTDGSNVVEFNGKAMRKESEETVNVCIQFTVAADDSTDFEAVYADIGGEALSLPEMGFMWDDIYDGHAYADMAGDAFSDWDDFLEDY